MPTKLYEITCCSSLSVPSEEEMQSDGKIVFPGQMNQNHQVPSCKGSTYCVTADNYPEDLVNNAIQQNENLKYLASVDIVSRISFKDYKVDFYTFLWHVRYLLQIPDVVVANRLDVTDEVPLCLATVRTNTLKGTRQSKNKIRKIIDFTAENFKTLNAFFSNICFSSLFPDCERMEVQIDLEKLQDV